MLFNKIVSYTIVLFGLLFFQTILSIYFDFIPDLLFIYLISNSLLKTRTEAIVCGFLFGFFQDCLTQGDLLGINALTKTFLSFFIGSIKFYGRSIHGVGNDDVRLTSRLFMPQSKLRGFNTRRVGPKDGEDWIGGNYATAMGFETQLPNLLPESTRTDVSVFIDAGNIWSVDYSDTLDDTNKIRSSIGVSANMWTTVGPFSLTIAQDLTKSLNDETEAINFRLGTSF